MDAKAKVLTVWIAHALGIVVTGSPFAGVIMAYFCRNTNDTPGFAGHNAAQIRSFWYGFLGWIVAIAMVVFGMIIAGANETAADTKVAAGAILLITGILVMIAVQIAFTIYAIIGIVRASKEKNWPGSEARMNSAAVFG